jgi:hypothetical protein
VQSAGGVDTGAGSAISCEPWCESRRIDGIGFSKNVSESPKRPALGSELKPRVCSAAKRWAAAGASGSGGRGVAPPLRGAFAPQDTSCDASVPGTGSDKLSSPLVEPQDAKEPAVQPTGADMDRGAAVLMDWLSKLTLDC